MAKLYKVLPSLLVLLLPVVFSSNVMGQDQTHKALSEIPVPGPDNLAAFESSLSSKIDGSSVSYSEFVIDQDALIDLGKSLFWDMQVGSDGIQACASCHFSGGADPRTENQLNPGLNDGDRSFQLGGPNYALQSSDFPFHKLSDEDDRKSFVESSVNEVVSSQGVVASVFYDIVEGYDEDLQDYKTRDKPFFTNGYPTRRVEPRNTPTTYNSVFNFRNFWDGRANNNFNGVNPFGNRDEHAKVVSADGSSAEAVKVLLPLSSGASQAVGPPLSDFEMSATGRTFAKVGKKMLSDGIVPLGKQVVHPEDSRLGSYSMDDGSLTINGMNTTYKEMIKAAFNERWWDSDAVVTFSEASNGTLVPSVVGNGSPANTDEYTVMEANFSLFFGLAIQAYEQLLITDETPFDDYALGNSDALTEAQKRGLDLFENEAKCASCHEGPTFSGATIDAIAGDDTDSESSFTIIERMEMGIHKGLATVVFAYGDIPTQDPGIENFNPLRSSPAGKLIEIKSSSTGEVMFSGVFPDDSSISVPPSEPCSSHSESIELTAVSPLVDTLSTFADAELKSHDNCSVSFRVRIENGFQSLPVGLYSVMVDYRRSGHVRVIEPAVYDNGFYNIGVRPTSEDIGLGGTDPFGNPLSFSLMELADPGRSDIRDGLPSSDGFNPSDPIGSLGELASVKGSFKTPSVRNLKMTAPYFHNGGTLTIEQVVRFYNRGGDFSDDNIADLDPDIVVLDLSEDEISDLVDFLENGLFDERTLNQSAPFDHPQLFYPEAHDEISGITVLDVADPVGASGGTHAETFEEELLHEGAAVAKAGSDYAEKIATDDVPEEFELAQNYPNPFNPTTTISFSLANPIHVELAIYNVLGQKVKTLVSSELDAGIHSVSWDGTSDAGELLSSGVYIYRLNTPTFEYSRKMTLTK